MKWHYEALPCGDGFAIHEIYIEGKKRSWTEEPVEVFGEDLETILKVLDMMKNDILEQQKTGNHVTNKSSQV